MEGSSSMEYIMDPKVLLLQHKLALVMGPEHCPIYDTINAVHPNALEEPWLDDMSGPSYKFIIFDNKAFTMKEAPSHEKAYVDSMQIFPIYCGENIKLYLDDSLWRDQQKGLTMDLRTLKRTEAIARRAIRSIFYWRLQGWVDLVLGGPGQIGPSPMGNMMVIKDKGRKSKKGKKKARETSGEVAHSA